MDAALETLPPIVTAFLALAFVLAWQVAGTALLAPVCRRAGINRGWSLVLGWFLWLPLCGGVALFLALIEVARPHVFQALAALVLAGVGASAWGRRHWFTSWRRTARASRPLLAATCGVGLLKVLEALYAAHPQRLYDQLNYHLVIAKQVLGAGHPFGKVYDTHLLTAGPIEYAFTWPRALIPGDFFEIAAAQCWIYVASVGTVIGATWVAAHRSGAKAWPWVVLAAAAAVPGLVPNGEMMSIAKPGAVLFAGTTVVLLAMVGKAPFGRALAVAFALMLTACNATYAHVSIAFAAVILLSWRKDHRPFQIPAPVWLIAAGVAGVAFFRCFVMTGTFLFPADARFLPSPYADDVTFQYWQGVAFSAHQLFPVRWTGAFTLPMRSPGLVTWLVLAAAAVLVGSKVATGAKPAQPSPRDVTTPAWQASRWFLVAFIVPWPLFYDGQIYTRFVGSYIAALIVMALLATLRAPPRLGVALAGVGIVLATVSSSADQLVRKIGAWNRGSLATAYATELPSYKAARAANAYAGPEDTVVSDNPAKYFFDGAVLASGVSPQEREVWAALNADPHGAADVYGVQAVVIEAAGRGQPDGDRPWDPPVHRLFEALMPYGTIQTIGPNLVLASRCHFQSLPCRQDKPLRKVVGSAN